MIDDILKALYNNTEEKYLDEMDEVKKSAQSIVFEEIGILLGLRKPSFSVDKVKAVAEFLEVTGFDYHNMYIVSKTKTSIDTVYKVGYIDKSNTFDIIIEENDDTIQAGLIINLERK
jgi:hypothetical protein